MPLAILGFFVLVAYWPGILSASVSPKWWVIWIGAPGFLLFELIRREVIRSSRNEPAVSQPQARPQRVPARSDGLLHLTFGHWLFAGFLAWSVLSLTWAVSVEDGLFALLQWIPLGLAFCLGVETADLRPFRIALGMGAVVSAIVVVAQLAGFDPIGLQAWQRGRPVGLFINYDVLGEFGAVALVGLLLDWRGDRHSRYQWALITAAAICAFAPLSRGAILGFVGSMCIIIGVQLRSRQRLAFWGLCAVWVFAALFVDGWLSAVRWQSMSTRLDYWNLTYTNLTWLGYGIGNYAVTWYAAGLGNYIDVLEFAHNEPLHFAFEIGVGSALLWWLFGWCLCAPGCAAEKGMLLAVLIEGLVGYPLHHAATALVAVVCAGRLARARHYADVAERARRAASSVSHPQSWRGPAGHIRPAWPRRPDFPV